MEANGSLDPSTYIYVLMFFFAADKNKPEKKHEHHKP